MSLRTLVWLALAASASLSQASPVGPAQVYADGRAVRAVAGNADAAVARVAPDAEPQSIPDFSRHWALYRRLANRRAPESPSSPDFSGRMMSGIPQAGTARPANLETCSAIRQDARRLACFDLLAKQPESPPQAMAQQQAAAEPVAVSPLSRHRELDDEAKQGTFLLTP